MEDGLKLNLKEILEVENNISTIIEKTVSKITAEVSKQTLTGVRALSSTCCVTNVSNLQHNIWTPEYYLPDIQAKYIAIAMLNIKTMSQLKEKLKNIIDARYIKINNTRHPLNNATIAVLEKYYNEFN